jgi:hypothetical protein
MLELTPIISQAVVITIFVFAMMLLVDYFNVLTKGKMERKCSECGKKLGFFEGYRHPVEGRKKCVCGKCFDKIEASEAKYCSFIGGLIYYYLIKKEKIVMVKI